MRASLRKTKTAISKLPVPVQLVERRIYMIRGQKVMLDADLAELYQVPTKRVNEQVQRNLARGAWAAVHHNCARAVAKKIARIPSAWIRCRGTRGQDGQREGRQVGLC